MDAANNSKLKNYKKNESYFEYIDSERKAYFLGFLFADGSVYINDKGNRTRCCELSVQKRDGYICEEFSRDIFNKIRVRNHTYKGTGETKAIISIYSKKICNDLIKLGCVQRKTFILQPPNYNFFNKKYLHHFIRGYFDGNGCAYILKEKYLQLSIYCASKEFVQWVSEVLSSNKIYFNIHKKGNIEAINICMPSNKNFYNFIYKDSTICLKRKKDKMEQIL